ncbi:hypothetical protein H3H37_07690 [Duganella sp. LX20W]|uniref:Uncharacterized protein n=1 Tax=Rugamonas brunnea TaxID=2758569 RepID=A0A7W2EQW4_9BURK|nr:hypothetical protein [Rugamonas brunnea]MBA5636933.1 hypothetical protein [Rugamonas brunnea]
MLTRATDNIIEELIDATYGDPADVRQRHVFAHALHGLVRLAKSEQLLDMRLDVARATSPVPGHSSRHQARALLRKIGMELARDAEGGAAGRPDTLHGGLEDR